MVQEQMKFLREVSLPIHDVDVFVSYGKVSLWFFRTVKSWSALSSPTIQAHTPDIAVMEAKKWIQEKSLVKTKTLESDHGPCSLNTTASYVSPSAFNIQLIYFVIFWWHFEDALALFFLSIDCFHSCGVSANILCYRLFPGCMRCFLISYEY